MSKTKEQGAWQPNEADLDLVTVGCECGNKFDIPWDVIAYNGLDIMFCGQCGESGKMKIINASSESK